MMFRMLLAVAGAASVLRAADPLSLRDAVRLAVEKHPSIEALREQTQAAGTRIGQARSALYPRVSYSEMFMTSDNPVFAFSTLLTQRRFAASNFQIDSLNNPGFTNNFQTQAGVEAMLWDFGATKARIRSAETARKMTEEDRRLAEMQRVAQVARLYHAVVVTQESLRVARSAVKSAEADLARAQAVREAGMSTDADVLSIQVHLAQTREQEIRRKYDIENARAALNEAMGVGLDAIYELTTPLASPKAPSEQAVARPEVKQAELARELAESHQAAARASLYPRIVARGMFEADRGRFVTRAGANWLFGAGLQWNLSTGGAEKRAIEEATHTAAAARARQREVSAAMELQVRQARSNLAAAAERVVVAEAAVAQSEESLRIIKNRFEAGFTTVTELLRNESAVVESRMRKLAAVYDQRVSAVLVDLAQGTLTGESNVLE